MLTIPLVHSDIPFVLSANQLKIHDAIHYHNRNLLLNIPRQWGLTYYIAYFAYMYQSVNMAIVSPNSISSNDIRRKFEHFVDQSSYHISSYNKFYSSISLKHSSFNGLYNKKLIIYPELDHVHFCTKHQDFIKRLGATKNTKVILCTQGNSKWIPENFTEVTLK